VIPGSRPPGVEGRHPTATAPDRMLAFAGAAVLATLGFEIVPLPIRAQITPLATLIAIVALPAALGRVRALPRSPIFTAVLAFVAFATVHSVVALGIDALACGPSQIRTTAWLRQLAALAAGAAVFAVLRVTLQELPDRTVARTVAIGALPGVLLAAVNVAWGALRVVPAARIVTIVRYTVIPPGLKVPGNFSDPGRASGFCFEPSHFSIFLATIAIPATVVWLAGTRRRRWLPIALIALESVALLWAFSITGVAVVAAILLALAVVGRFRRLALAALASGCVVLAVLTATFPKNYIAHQVRKVAWMLARGDYADLPPSVTVVFYGTFGPFARALSSLNLLGYGLGGTATHAAAILPPAALRDIKLASWSDMPNLTTSVGRVFAETGLVGLGLFAAMWVTAFRRLSRRPGAPPPGGLSPTLRVAAVAGVVGLAIAHTIKLGSFAIPFMWFWLAYLDARTTAGGADRSS